MSVGTELLNEIERVSAKRQRWLTMSREVPGMANGMAVGIALMGHAIDSAKTAIAENDAVACIRSLEKLREYDSDD